MVWAARRYPRCARWRFPWWRALKHKRQREREKGGSAPRPARAPVGVLHDARFQRQLRLGRGGGGGGAVAVRELVLEAYGRDGGDDGLRVVGGDALRREELLRRFFRFKGGLFWGISKPQFIFGRAEKALCMRRKELAC